MREQHTVTNKSDCDIRVLMDDGWKTVAPGESVTGVLQAVNNGRKRTLYSIEPYVVGQTPQEPK